MDFAQPYRTTPPTQLKYHPMPSVCPKVLRVNIPYSTNSNNQLKDAFLQPEGENQKIGEYDNSQRIKQWRR